MYLKGHYSYFRPKMKIMLLDRTVSFKVHCLLQLCSIVYAVVVNKLPFTLKLEFTVHVKRKHSLPRQMLMCSQVCHFLCENMYFFFFFLTCIFNAFTHLCSPPIFFSPPVWGLKAASVPLVTNLLPKP